ncbi:IS3 family transposase [Alicyclobacillus suci]|uniref:IS3 family transposase n=1 Tax=Alicyclobacillus suci TaxID=2816080 RepID=UPI001A904069
MKQRIRHLCERFPRYGYRRIKVMLRRQYSMQVNHKRVHRLMCILSSKNTRKNRVFLPIDLTGTFHRCFINACFIL